MINNSIDNTRFFLHNNSMREFYNIVENFNLSNNFRNIVNLYLNLHRILGYTVLI